MEKIYYTKDMKTYKKLYDYLKTQDDYVSGEKLAQEFELSRTAIWKAIKTLEDKGFKFIRLKNAVIKLSQAIYYSLNKLRQILILRSL